MSHKRYEADELLTRLTRPKYNAEKAKWPRFRDDFKAKLISEGAELFVTLTGERKEYTNNADDKYSERCRKIYGKLWKLLGEDAKDIICNAKVSFGDGPAAFKALSDNVSKNTGTTKRSLIKQLMKLSMDQAGLQTLSKYEYRFNYLRGSLLGLKFPDD